MIFISTAIIGPKHELNGRRSLCRFQFFESLIGLASAKFCTTGICKDKGSALEKLIEGNINTDTNTYTNTNTYTDTDTNTNTYNYTTNSNTFILIFKISSNTNTNANTTKITLSHTQSATTLRSLERTY